MRKIDLQDYTVEVDTAAGPKALPYSVRPSLVEALYHPDLNLSARGLMENHAVATKIQNADTAVLLEEAEYARLRLAFETIKGFGRKDIDLVRRVLEAPAIEVAEKQE